MRFGAKQKIVLEFDTSSDDAKLPGKRLLIISTLVMSCTCLSDFRINFILISWNLSFYVANSHIRRKLDSITETENYPIILNIQFSSSYIHVMKKTHTKSRKMIIHIFKDGKNLTYLEYIQGGNHFKYSGQTDVNK